MAPQQCGCIIAGEGAGQVREQADACRRRGATGRGAGFNQEDIKIGEKMTRAHNAHSIMIRMHAKYVDDLTVDEALHITKVLNVERGENLTRPLNHHQRTEHRLVPGCSKVTRSKFDL